MRAMFCINSFANDCRVKYATRTLMDSALNWWDNHTKFVRIDATCVITWETLKQMMIKEYCSQKEIQAL